MVQFGEQMVIVVLEPVVEGTLLDTLDGVNHDDGNQFANGEDGPAMVRNIRQGVVHPAVKFGDTISDIHEVSCCGVYPFTA